MDSVPTCCIFWEQQSENGYFTPFLPDTRLTNNTEGGKEILLWAVSSFHVCLVLLLSWCCVTQGHKKLYWQANKKDKQSLLSITLHGALSRLNEQTHTHMKRKCVCPTESCFLSVWSKSVCYFCSLAFRFDFDEKSPLQNTIQISCYLFFHSAFENVSHRHGKNMLFLQHTDFFCNIPTVFVNVFFFLFFLIISKSIAVQ